MEIWFGKELIKEWEENVKLERIRSFSREIRLEIFESKNKKSPVIIFSHGIAGYARVLLPFVIPLCKLGYTVIVPDLQGYGYNDGVKGDSEWNEHVQNLIDTSKYANNEYDGPIFLGGASMGGPLAYSAGAISSCVDGLVCWCLWDFSDKEFMLNETSTGKATYILMPIFNFLSKYMGKVRIKTYHLVSYDTLSDSKRFNTLVKNDPQAGTHITLKGAASLVLDSKPPVKHKDFTKPVLVVQPGEDKMTPKKYIKKTFDALGSKKKRYIEIENIPHFPTERKVFDRWADEVNKFIKEIIED